MNHPSEHPLFGIKFWTASQEDLMDKLLKDVSCGESGILVTPNLSFLYQCRISREAIELIKNSKYVTCDSKYVSFLYKMAFGVRLPLMPGSALIYELLEMAENQQIPIGVIGGSLATEEIVHRLQYIYPNLIVKFCYSGFINEDNSNQIRDLASQMRDAQAQLFFVGLGFPKQERISTKLLDNGASGLYINVGMGLNYLLKTQRRAPKVMQFFALEWLWRVLVEPKRLARRYFVECLPELIRQIKVIFNWRIR